jgi:hypothetical protein
MDLFISPVQNGARLRVFLALLIFLPPLGRRPPHKLRTTFSRKRKHRLATFEAFRERFGITNTTAYKHLNLMTRHKRLFDIQRQDVCVPHLRSRLDLPIYLIQVFENHVVVPIATQKPTKNSAARTEREKAASTS